MLLLVWLCPALAVIGLVASGRASVSAAAALGASAALAVSLFTAPRSYGVPDAAMSVARGAWIGAVVVPYILGGLLFWRMALRRDDAAAGTAMPGQDGRGRRQELFTACFLVGPFAESATGFGAGILGTSAIVRQLGLPAAAQRFFPLLSQAMVPWGAMGSGMLIGAAFAGISPTALAACSFPILVAVQAVWLPIFWRAATRAGLPATAAQLLAEAAWLTVALAAVFGATILLGPEVAMLAAYGPLIAARWLLSRRPRAGEAVRTLRAMSPFALLIGGLVLSRLWEPVNAFLLAAGRLQPFAGAPAWSPLSHAGDWLFAGALLIAVVRRDLAGLRQEAGAAWRIGRVAVLGVVLFSVMAELLAGSGIAGALASRMFAAADRWALLLTPLLSGSFGLLANTGNASNGLFMASEVDLARLAGLNVWAVIAIQHVSGIMASIFSPVRMAILCGLAGTPGREKAAYRDFVPYLASLLVLLTCAALLVCCRLV